MRIAGSPHRSISFCDNGWSARIIDRPQLPGLARGAATVNLLAHCNAGSLATVDLGAALASVYQAHRLRIAVHVWADETRPRNERALTAYELAMEEVPQTVIADGAAALLIHRGKVDLFIVGAD
jgi:methylthioribose-1-phosphate isomerase